MTEDRIGKVRALFSRNGAIMRTAQLREAGICSKDIRSLMESNHILRLKDGYYAWQDLMDRLSDFQIAAATIPNATISSLSAASVYGLTTVIPDTVHIAIPNAGREPQKPFMPPIEFTQYKPALFHLGRSAIQMESHTLPIYDRERTVCDCFKRRSEIGDDVALEVIKNYMRGKKDIQKLYTYAQKMRIQQKLHPYVEALL